MMNENSSTWDEEQAHPPLFGKFLEGWSSLFQKEESGNPPPQTQKDHYTDDASSTTNNRISDTSSASEEKTIQRQRQIRRKSSIQVGNEVMTELLEKDNVRNAIEILQQALAHLDMTQKDNGENTQAETTKIYSQIIRSLCEPTVSKIVDEMTPSKDIYQSVLWRLFTKVVESGYVLETDAHLAVVSWLIDKGHVALALQAMYALPRKEWDTQCYRTAVLLHLMQDPKQIAEAQALLSDYGKPYLEIPNPTSPSDLPPLRIDMPLMKDVTEKDQLKLWMFFEATQSKDNNHWNREKAAYEAKRAEHLEQQKRNSTIDWTLENLKNLNIESEKEKVDHLSMENDNTMIYVATVNKQFEYGWQVYISMGEAVNDDTPCIVMHLCWVAFRQIPIADMSYRAEWEKRAWTVYARFMCSEHLHPDQSEAPTFIHDILSIATYSPETTTDKKARYTKAMSVYNLLVRLQFQKLLCDDRVLEPILCTLLYECKGTPTNIVNMCNKAFEIWDRKWDILIRLKLHTHTRSPYSMIWGLVILCLKSGNEIDLQKVLYQLWSKHLPHGDIPSTLLAPIQAFHDKFLCGNDCYFHEYMFRRVEYTDDTTTTAKGIDMTDFGFIPSSSSGDDEIEREEEYSQTLSWRTNINEPQEPNIAMAVLMGAAKQEKLVQKQMYYSTKKAKAIIGHIIHSPVQIASPSNT